MPTQPPAVISARDISGTDTPTTDDDGGCLTVTGDCDVELTGSATGGWTPGRSALWFEVEDGALTLAGADGVTVRAARGDLVQALASRFVVARYRAADVWTVEGTGSNVDDHVADTTGAHAASAISFAPASGISATDVQAAIVEALADANTAAAAAVSAIVDSSPSTLDTLNELAAALGDDPNFAATTAALIAAAQTAADDAQDDLDTHTAATSGAHGISAFGATLIDDASASAARTTLGLVIGTDVAAPAETWTWRGFDTKTGAYTLVLGDAGKLLEMDGNADFTIPANSSVAFPIGTQIGLLLADGHTGNIVDASGVVLNGETAGDASLAMTPHQIAVATKLATDRWNVSGV